MACITIPNHLYRPDQHELDLDSRKEEKVACGWLLLFLIFPVVMFIRSFLVRPAQSDRFVYVGLDPGPPVVFNNVFFSNVFLYNTFVHNAFIHNVLVDNVFANNVNNVENAPPPAGDYKFTITTFVDRNKEFSTG